MPAISQMFRKIASCPDRIFPSFSVFPVVVVIW